MKLKSILVTALVVIFGPLTTEAQSISDIRVSNYAAFSVSIGWVTDTVSEGYVLYGNPQRAVHVDDIRGPDIQDDIHYVRIEGLEPETSYAFDVVSGDSIVRDLNFTTVAVDPVRLPELNVIGRIATSEVPSNNGLSDAIVYVTIVRGVLESPLLSTLITMNTGEDWIVNLGNLKSAHSDAPFVVKSQDIIEVFATGGQSGLGVSLHYTVADGNFTFLDTGTLLLSTDTLSATLQFEPGLNLIAPEHFPFPRLTASDLLRLPDITQVSRWSNLEKLFHSVIENEEDILGSDFKLRVSDAYFVRSKSQRTQKIEGISMEGSVKKPLYTGLNLLSIVQPNMNLSAFDVLEQIPDGTEVTRFDRVSQLYTSAVQIESRTVGEDFPVTVGEGYFVRVRADGVWSPSIATPRRTVSVRHTGIRYGGLKRIPAFTSAGPNVKQAVDALILSNISSTSVTVSWLNQKSNRRRILIGPSPSTLNHEIRPTEVKSSAVQQIEVIHLTPVTTYYIRMITENGPDDGPLFRFTTSKMDVGNPYSLFGRLVEQDEFTPVPQNLITVRIDRESNRSDLLSTLTDAEGYWTVNLGNLKDPETGMPFAWQAGDPIQIIAHGTGGTETRDISQQITGHSPQNTVPVYKTETEQKLAGPKVFSLNQNFPNPFNPSTKISYTIANSQAVYTTLTVFNILGQKIKTLVSRMHQPGRYTIIWDGTDSRDRQVTSGVYFYRIESGPEHDTRSMILLR